MTAPTLPPPPRVTTLQQEPRAMQPPTRNARSSTRRRGQCDAWCCGRPSGTPGMAGKA
ncbi:hypothetical protein E2C01_089700 [Portunus trituberculatus]|uniref:Uncharacterized protein n=1 Tax=Portunus trituberculatus TaxID=210409 RepID=A0A5B7JN58_PORTR|nr:hypothetical protein [Portunus trituberculatus]